MPPKHNNHHNQTRMEFHDNKLLEALRETRVCTQCQGTHYCPFCYGQPSNRYCAHCDISRFVAEHIRVITVARRDIALIEFLLSFQL